MADGTTTTMKNSSAPKDMRQLNEQLGDKTKAHIEANIVRITADKPPLDDCECQEVKTTRPYEEGSLAKLLPETEPIKFPELAKRYLKTELLNARGEPRSPTRSEAVVAIVDHFKAVLEGASFGIARLNGSLHIFHTDHWEPTNDDEIQSTLGKFAQDLGHRLSEARHFQFRAELAKQLFSACDTIHPEPGKSAVNFLNGTLHIDAKGERLEAHRQGDGLTYVLPFHYDTEADCPQFDRYLARVLPDSESQTVLFEFLGWIFLRDLKLEKMLILYGSGHNGKSVLFDITTALLGETNISALSLESLKTPEKRLPLVGKLLNYGSEVSGNVAPDILKKASSGEPLEFRRLYGDPFTSPNYARLAFNANTLPSETEITDGFFRRFLIIPFEQTITAEEKDPDLASKIIANELPGVMNHVLDGMRRLRASRKFSPCRKADECLRTYQNESDTVAQFLEEEGWTADPEGRKGKSELFQEYSEYCTASGFSRLNIKKFASRLKTHHRIKDGKSGPTRYWHLSHS